MFLRKKNVTKTGPDPPPQCKKCCLFFKASLRGGFDKCQTFFFFEGFPNSVFCFIASKYKICFENYINNLSNEYKNIMIPYNEMTEKIDFEFLERQILST